MVKHPQQINNYLRLYRKKNGLSQKEVAYLIGHKTTNSISNYERGNKLPQLTNLLKLEIIYRTPAAFLFHEQYQELRKKIREKEQRLQKMKPPEE